MALILFPAQVLTVESGPVAADAMEVLGGGASERSQRAVEWFKAGEAPRIIVSSFGDCGRNDRIIETNGVPASVIDQECESRTTFENAKFSIPLLRSPGAGRVIIVTSWSFAPGTGNL